MSASTIASEKTGGSTLATSGADGNEHLTTIVAFVLLALFAVLAVTILQIHQLISIHLFVGMLLAGPVALKMASTGYRFTRYYTGNQAYRRKGPPTPAMRLLAPGVVATTLVVFASGFVLLINGPAHRSTMLSIHKASFLLWLGLTGSHVLGHLPALGRTLLAGAGERTANRRIPGKAVRWVVLAAALGAGLALAFVFMPHYSAWSHWGSLHHGG